MAALRRQPRPLHRGDRVYRQGESFRGIYLVQSGSLKSTVVNEDGHGWIAALHFPGEALGVDALDGGVHQQELRALETTSVCVLPARSLAGMAPRVRAAVFERVASLIASGNRTETMRWQLLCRVGAEERFASFLLSLSARMAAAGKDPELFDIHLSRKDIASYLGLAPETVSRLFRRFHDDGLIAAVRSQIRLCETAALATLAHGRLRA